MRNDTWLSRRLNFIWSKYFKDVPPTNKVLIKFGRFARFRLGSIKLDKRRDSSMITITGLFKNPQVPTLVVDYTIAHELTHYSHGFSSPHPKQHKYPHEGGVVKKEMLQRGMGYLNKAYHLWVKEYKIVLHSRKKWIT